MQPASELGPLVDRGKQPFDPQAPRAVDLDLGGIPGRRETDQRHLAATLRLRPSREQGVLADRPEVGR